jgi:hypothetical protein
MNSNELRAQMARNGDTGQALAKALKLSLSSFSMKLNGKRGFTQNEILFIKLRYNLTPKDIDYIFFSREVE